MVPFLFLLMDFPQRPGGAPPMTESIKDNAQSPNLDAVIGFRWIDRERYKI